MNSTSLHRTTCNRDCPDACSLLATVEDGRVTRLQGDPDHPVTRGFLCRRTSRFLDRQYSPDRLTRPLVRRGEEYREIGWEAALDMAAEQLLRFRSESGPASILHYRCGGSMGILKHVSDYFFQCFGPVTIKSGDVCSGAGEAAQETDFGCCDSHDLFDLRHSRTIVLWGKNVFVSSVHLIPLLREARNRGARLLLIDPVHHRTASLCDQVLQPRPGGDAALACGMARWLFEHSGVDAEAAHYCDHFEAYGRLVRSRSIEQWATLAGVTAEDLETAAMSYHQGPSTILVGWGLQRRRFGATTVRCLDALTAISGNLGIPGGGVSFCFRRRGAFDLTFCRPEIAPRTIPEPLLGPGILQQTDPPIRMVWVTAGNPVAMLPDSRTVAEALRSREFTAVVDSFLTDTARCADLILPTTTMLEEDDLLGAYGHHWLAESRPVVAPPPGIRSDFQIAQELAPRVGMTPWGDDDVKTWKERILHRLGPHDVDLARLRQGAVKNPLAEEVLFADRRFPTPSGKVNLIRELPDDLLQNPASGTMTLSALATSEAQASQWPTAAQQGPATATVHPHAAPDFREGELVQLRTARGTLRVVLRFDAQQRLDVVRMDKGGWLHTGRCANSLIHAELTDDGQCAVYYDTPVQIEPLAALDEADAD